MIVALSRAVFQGVRADTARTQGFFYETVAPILSVGSASLVAISTLTSEINFYTRLIKVCVFVSLLAHLHV